MSGDASETCSFGGQLIAAQEAEKNCELRRLRTKRAAKKLRLPNHDDI